MAATSQPQRATPYLAWESPEPQTPRSMDEEMDMDSILDTLSKVNAVMDDLIQNPQSAPKENTMTDLTREEMKAEILASERGTETKIARFEGKLDLVLLKLDTVEKNVAEGRAEQRSTKANIWVVGLGLAALLIGLAFGIPTIFSYGQEQRDVIHNEVQQQLQTLPAQ